MEHFIVGYQVTVKPKLSKMISIHQSQAVLYPEFRVKILNETKQIMLRCSMMSDSLPPHRPHSSPPVSSVHFLGKTVGMGCHFLLQEIFLTQGSN